jgi:hypothetical protein
VTNRVALSLGKIISNVGLSLSGSSQKHHDRHNLSLKNFIIIVSIFKPNVLALLRQGGLFIFSLTACMLSIFYFFSVDVVSRLLSSVAHCSVSEVSEGCIVIVSHRCYPLLLVADCRLSIKIVIVGAQLCQIHKCPLPMPSPPPTHR